jgi:uncharacterized protein YqgC (DUF456 family)
MVDPVSILVGLLEFLLNVIVGIVLDFLLDFLLEFLWELLQELLEALLELVDPVALLAIALLVLGVVGAALPVIPGPLLSLAGVWIFWINSGFSDPGLGWVLVFTALGLAALFVDYFGGLVSARVGGASMGTAMAAVLVGILLGLIGLGPIGFLIGTMATVFGLEYYRHENAERAIQSATVTVTGMLGSAIAQFVLTGAILVLMLWTLLP